MPYKQAVESRPEAVDVARGLDAVEVPRRLFGAHVLRSADCRSRPGQRRIVGNRARGDSSTASPSGSASDLAMPQSTTSVSPNRPSMIFSGFRSRCTTPRL